MMLSHIDVDRLDRYQPRHVVWSQGVHNTKGWHTEGFTEVEGYNKGVLSQTHTLKNITEGRILKLLTRSYLIGAR